MLKIIKIILEKKNLIKMVGNVFVFIFFFVGSLFNLVLIMCFYVIGIKLMFKVCVLFDFFFL